MMIKKVGIIGCGAMGSGIAQVILQGGYGVIVNEPEQKNLDAGIKRIEKALEKFVKREEMTDGQIQEIQARLTGSINLEELSDCDLVIEAIFEDIKVKQDLFESLDRMCKKETILASNTSSLSITQMAAFTNRPNQFVGLHFFNPVPFNPLIEVVKIISTPSSLLETISNFVGSLGKVPVIAEDNAGFIVNLLLTPFMLNAMQAAATGVASIKDIDTAMKLGCNHPMGPLMLADFIGLDVIYHASNNMFDEYKDRSYAPPSILKKMVLSGNWGQKTGRGFYDWADLKNPEPLSI